MTEIVGLIPAHMSSVRFPNKILFEFAGLPMIEHVRRRALMAGVLAEVAVATCDVEIAEAVRTHGGKVVMTADTHTNGTSRIAEAIEQFDASHVLLLQGDEPLLLPRHVRAMVLAITADPENEAWNATAPIKAPDELDRHSFVKCTVAEDGHVMYAFRRTPSSALFEAQTAYIRKILGLIAYRRDFLLRLAGRAAGAAERTESIEQLRILELGGRLTSVPVEESLPSVNEPHEAQIVLDYLASEPEQQTLLEKVLSNDTGPVA